MQRAQQEAVAAWKYIESRGFTPSVRMVGRLLREFGIGVRDSTLREYLSTFRAAAQPQHGRKADATGPRKTRTRDAVGPQSGRSRDASGPRLRAHDKVSLSQSRDTDCSLRSQSGGTANASPDASQESLFGEPDRLPETPAAELKRRRKSLDAQTRPEGSPPYDLAAAVYDRTVASGLRSAVRAEAAVKTRSRHIRADVRAAKELLDRYEFGDIADKFDALFGLVAADRRKCMPTCTKLLAAWDDSDLRTEPRRELLDPQVEAYLEDRYGKS